MSVCRDILKKCPQCGSRARMQMRGGVVTIDLDDAEELAAVYTPEQLVDLFDSIQADGDPFICSQGHSFHLDDAKRIKVAKELFGS